MQIRSVAKKRMALVCDIKSDSAEQAEDLEDGEIEDDEEEPQEPPAKDPSPQLTPNKEKEKDRDRRRHRHEEKPRKHMTEAEKSILHLRKREKMQREKWEKFRQQEREAMLQHQDPMDDDFAKNIEKTLATILQKKEKQAISGDEEEEKRGKKRRKQKNKRNEGSQEEGEDGSPSKSDDGSEGSDCESDPETKVGRKRSKRKRKRDKRTLDVPKDSQPICSFFLQGKCQKNDCEFSHEVVPPMKLELCKFYVMDRCAKGEKCSYMHSDFPCKFYHTGLSCLQGENCKFAHGKPLSENLKSILFKHIETAPRDILGGFPRVTREEALNMINQTQKALIENHGAPDGGGDNAILNMLYDINVPVPSELNDDKLSDKSDKPARNRKSRWQDPEPVPNLGPTPRPFIFNKDQDMRFITNGDIDMRTLPPPNLNTLPPNLAPIIPPNLTSIPPPNLPNLSTLPPNYSQIPPPNLISIPPPNILNFAPPPKELDLEQYKREALGKEVQQVVPNVEEKQGQVESEDEQALHIDTGDQKEKEEKKDLPDLPKTQMDLYLRIQAQQKETKPEEEQDNYFNDENINWYSDDDDDEDRLMIKVEEDKEEKKDGKEDEEEDKELESVIMSPPQIKPLDVVEKLGDLSKIDISAEVTKLLSSMSQKKEEDKGEKAIRDPRLESRDPRLDRDPRRARLGSLEDRERVDKISIYEQGAIDGKEGEVDSKQEDFRGRSDVDLRNLQLPFKGMENYTPATEIDASINSHPAITWKVYIVDIPRPDYTGLKLTLSDAEKTGDPRLRKIFRLSTEEKDSPASPKASPKASGTPRVDPRLRKMEEKQDQQPLNYNQQLNMLQSSVFYQSLTSNQKVLLNQELASRTDQTGSHDPLLNTLLSNLNLIPPGGTASPQNPNLGVVLAILANVNKNSNQIVPTNTINPAIMSPAPIINQMALQPGLLGAAPGVPNMGPEFPPMGGYDPRNPGPGILGNGPPPPFGNFQQDNFNNFNDDYYEGNSFHQRDRGFNRDRRRGRNNFNRNNGNRNFNRNNRINRSNRAHTPP